MVNKEEYKAEKRGKEIVIKPHVEKKTNKQGGQDIKIKVPNLSTIQKLKKEVQNGKRNI